MSQKDALVELIVARLQAELSRAKAQFLAPTTDIPTRFAVIDDLLPAAEASRIFAAFSPEPSKWREMSSLHERKLTTKKLDAFAPLLADITFAFQAPAVIRVVEEITGRKQQEGDPHLYAGGLSMMRRGDFLNPHIDNSHNQERSRFRTLNLLYYVTPEWKEEYGGNLELWDTKVRKPTTLFSKFNRLVLMETHRESWHSVSPVENDGTRCCVSNYYFSTSTRHGDDYFHVTSFSARPEQPFRRLYCRLDTLGRTALRRVVKGGLGRKDVFGGKDS